MTQTIKAQAMKALVKAKAEKGLWLQDVPIPEIAPNEVLIKIERTAICGTDMHIYKWDEWAQHNVPVGLVVGHEYGGSVAAIGSTVKRVKVGDRVTGEGHVVGRRSRNARAGKFHLDPDTKGIGVNLPGAFAQYLALPEFNVIPLKEDFPLEIASIMDPLGNAVHTALAYDLVGEDVLITGAGPIGIMAAAVAEKGIYGRQMYETWYKMLALLDSGLDVSPMITHHFAARDFQEAFDLMETGKSGKVILNWDEI